jgi:hypothetical protein
VYKVALKMETYLGLDFLIFATSAEYFCKNISFLEISFSSSEIFDIRRAASSSSFPPFACCIKKTGADLNQCDQVGRNFSTWATLGYLFHNQFSPNQAVSIHGLL